MQKISIRNFFFVLIVILSPALGFGQSAISFWTDYSSKPAKTATSFDALIHARKAEYLTFDFQSLHAQIFSSDATDFNIDLPLANGKFQEFKLKKNTLMAPGLNEKFPEVRAFNIVSTGSRSIWGKFEISPKGIHALIFQPGKSTVFVDPLYANEPSTYIAYAKNDFLTDKVMDCRVEANPTKGYTAGENPKSDYNDCQLRTYRLALAATGEYTVFQGGTAANAFDAMVTTMNRVNGVYERDFAVTMVMVENTDELIYTNAGSDPYTNGSPGQMINENQSTVDMIIGSDNYDIGHVFGTNSGGLAGLGVTCFDGSKARGVTGSGAPIGDSFDIDYVAHEMGHEFGGDHSFNNSCGGNRNDGTAVEPGSGTTIMGYAGICPPDIQQHSDDYFHGINMEEIGIQITNNTCQVNTSLDNNSPEINALTPTIYIPISTPFSLSASASDIDGDSLTYCWEQSDTEISDQPPVPFATGGPSFRSMLPAVDSTRYFPNLQDLANGGPFTWEQIPSVARTMSFRVTVRDNVAGGGCTQYEDVTVSAVEGTGPFKVTYPTASGISWNGFDYETITWDVANTIEAPINADLVDIFLSTDGGDSYPIQLADNVENLGAFAIQVPNLSTTEARIMVMNSDGTFFDISDNDFSITSIESGFTFATDSLEYTLCQDNLADIDFSIVGVGDFSSPIDLAITELPQNGTAQLSSGQANIGDDLTLSITSLVDVLPGVYPLTITGTSGDFSNAITYTITVVASSPVAAQPLLPENDAQNVSTDITLTWENNAGPLETYTLEVATNSDFSNTVTTVSGLEDNSYSLSGLSSETTYFWRVVNSTFCGNSDASEENSFTTYSCEAYAAQDLPLAISDTNTSTISSQIDIPTEGVIADVNVVGLQGTHTNVSDLSFALQSPNGTVVNLAAAICGLNLTIAPNGQITVNGISPEETFESSGTAVFGPNITSPGITGIAVLAQDGSANPDELCEPAVNAAQLNGKIALIYRANCDFVDKVQNAQDAGAIAAIIINNIAGDGFFNMGGNSNSINIPSVMVSLEDGNVLLAASSANSQDFNFSFDDQAETAVMPCPAITGQAYQPLEPLSAFNGENSQGTWTLSIVDNTNEDGGSLAEWSLNFCLTGEDVGISNVEKDASRVYPNPVNHTLTVEMGGSMNVDQIQILDLLGRVIKSEKVSGRKLIEMDLSNLTPGVYLVHLKGNENDSKVYKIVKQ